MKINIKFDNFESKQNGTCVIEIDAQDLLTFIAEVNEKAAKVRAEVLKEELNEGPRQKPGKA